MRPRIQRRGAQATAVLVAIGMVVVTASSAFGAAGVLDTGFSGDGRQAIDLSPGSDRAFDLVLQADDKPVIVGSASGLSGSDMSIARLRVGGALDKTFSKDGKLTVDFGGVDQAVAVARQGRKILVGGSTSGAGAVVRLTERGRRDRTFSKDGRLVLSVPGYGPVTLTDIADGRDGRIVVVGSAIATGEVGSDALVIRLTPAGKLDRRFSGDGVAVISKADALQAETVLVLPDGRVLVGVRGSQKNSQIYRLKPRGTLDKSFGGGDGAAQLPDDHKPLALARDRRRIVLAGEEKGGPPFVARFKADGTPSAGFGGGGFRTIDDAAVGPTTLTDVAVQPDRSILLSATNGTQQVIRLTPSGALDASFAGGLGVLQIGSSLNSSMDAVAVDRKRRILAAASIEVFDSTYVQTVYRITSE
jgi:uncharacterized delta-60 repeat protein